MPSVVSSQVLNPVTGSITIITGGTELSSNVTLDAVTGRTVMIGTNVYRGTANAGSNRFWDDRRFGVEDGFWNDGCP